MNQIDTLEQFFNSITLPKEIQLSKSERILNVDNFVKVHIAYCKRLSEKASSSYLTRLLTLKTILEK